MEYELSYSIGRNANGEMVYQEVKTYADGVAYVRTGFEQKDGALRFYGHYAGESKGAPLRGKSRQAQIARFIESVKAAVRG